VTPILMIFLRITYQILCSLNSKGKSGPKFSTTWIWWDKLPPSLQVNNTRCHEITWSVYNVILLTEQ